MDHWTDACLHSHLSSQGVMGSPGPPGLPGPSGKPVSHSNVSFTSLWNVVFSSETTKSNSV